MKKQSKSSVNPYYDRYKSLNRERLNMYNLRLYKRQTLYFDDDGNEVTDVTKAAKDVYGKPIVSRLSSKNTLPYEEKNPRITFNPADPLARQRAFTARLAFSELNSVPVDYGDTFKSIEYVNNVAEKVTSIIKSQPSNNE